RGTADLDPDDFDATLLPRFDNDRSGVVDAAELERGASVIGGILAAGLVVGRGGVRCTAEVDSARAVPAARLVRAQLSYRCPAAGSSVISVPLFDRLRPSHSHCLTVRFADHVAAAVLTSDQ